MSGKQYKSWSDATFFACDLGLLCLLRPFCPNTYGILSHVPKGERKRIEWRDPLPNPASPSQKSVMNVSSLRSLLMLVIVAGYHHCQVIESFELVRK